MKKKHLLTKESFTNITAELHRLIEVERPRIIKEIQMAREQGDLSENADYDSAKEQQSHIESRILELQEIIANHQIIDETSAELENVTIGCKVSVRHLTEQKVYEYEIVGSYDTDPKNNKISNECPVAKALLGKKKGDIAQIKGLLKPYKLEILSIKR